MAITHRLGNEATQGRNGFFDRRAGDDTVGHVFGTPRPEFLPEAVERDRRIRRDENGEDYARLRAGPRRALRGEWYRASETPLRRDSLSDFNDGCKDFAELRARSLCWRARRR